MVGFQCLPGFTLVGSTHLSCQITGQWSDATPSCTPVECPLLLASQHTRILQQNNSFTGLVTYACQTGYEQAGGMLKLSCESSGRWNGVSLRCQGKDVFAFSMAKAVSTSCKES